MTQSATPVTDLPPLINLSQAVKKMRDSEREPFKATEITDRRNSQNLKEALKQLQGDPNKTGPVIINVSNSAANAPHTQ